MEGYPIKIAAQKSGLTVHTIRVWEIRYAAITPERTKTQRRLYTEKEIRRLTLLHDVTKAGYSIGSVARLPDDQLEIIAGESKAPRSSDGPRSNTSSAETLTSEAIESIRKLDGRSLETTLRAGLVQLGLQALLMKVISPLATQVGDLWRKGEISAAHEHFSTAVIRNVLATVQKQFAAVAGAPRLMVATPIGQLHELGAILCATAASNLGWNVIYLGTSLPAAELAGVAISSNARAIALSIVFPAGDPVVTNELVALASYLPGTVKVIAGGRAAPSYDQTLNTTGGRLVGDLDEFCSVLDSIWTKAGSPQLSPTVDPREKAI